MMGIAFPPVHASADPVAVTDQAEFDQALVGYVDGSVDGIEVSGVPGSLIAAPNAPAVYGGANGPLTIDFDATRFDVNSGLTLGLGSAMNFTGGAPATTAGAGYMRIGNDATATLNIEGGALTFNGDGGSNPARLWVGANSDSGTTSSGTLNMSSGSITFNDGAGASDYGGLAIGRDGGVTGLFNQTGGSVTFNGESAIDIGTQGGTGTYSLSGNASFLATDNATLYVGSRTDQAGGIGAVSAGALSISGDASFTVESATQVFIGDAKATGTVTQSGSSTVSIEANRVWLGSNTNNAGGASGGGTGVYNLQGGTLNINASSNEHFVLGHALGGSGTFNQTGGNFTLTGGLGFGAGTGIYNLDGGTVTLDGITGTGAAGSAFNFRGGTLIASTGFTTSAGFATGFDAASTVQVNGTDNVVWNSVITGDGTLTKTGTGKLTFGAANAYDGDVTLQGGTLALNNVTGLGSGDVSLGGGTTFDLTGVATGGRVVIGELSGSGSVLLGDSYLETTVGAGNSVAFSGTLNSDTYGYQSNYGRFYKAGAGDLVINGSTMNKGEAYITAGSMTQSAGDTAWANINVGGDGGNGVLNVSGGTLTLSVGLRVGDFGGTGTVNQTGGTVKLEQTCDDDDRCPSLNIGNQGGTGIYNISAGSLLLEGGSHSIGRNAGNWGSSSGTLNVSGGLVQLDDGGFLVIGDRDQGTQPNSSGAINQTGGTLRVSEGSRLYLGGYGAGTYNLNAGTLEIGGSSLNGLYGGGGGTGSYDFNLGGGTIKVIGSDLTASVLAELTGASTSTFNTNGFNAAWNGALSGSGNLAKAGAGTLTLGAANSFTGDVSLSGGTLALANTAALSSVNDVAVGAGTTFDISGANGPTFTSVNVGLLSGTGTVDVGNNSLVVNVGAGLSSAFGGTLLADKHSYESDNDESSLVKSGAGALVVNGLTADIGNIYVRQGTLEQSAGTTNIAYLAVGSGAAAVTGNNSALNISGGTLNIGEALQVGDWGGVGTVNQTGGAVTIEAECGVAANCSSFNIGNQGGTGTYNISNGQLTLVGGLHSIGRNTSQNGGSGTLNVNGGVVELQLAAGDFGPGSIIIGDRSDGAGTHASGSVNQTGGVFRIGAGTSLYLGGYGAGTYNLNGGALQIGGASLQGVYNNVGGSYAFNLGGGTIQVAGSDLLTSVDATLVGGTTSTIDTNGLGATWNGVLSGAGNLVKAGAGTLALTNAGNSYSGTTGLTGGTLQVSEGALGSGALIFGATSTFAFVGGYTLGNDVTLGAGAIGTFNVGENQTSTLSGQILGAGGLAKTGLGELVLDGSNNIYTGPTQVSAGMLTVASDGALSDVSALTVASGAFFQLLGVAQSVEELNGDGNVLLGAGSVLTVAPIGDSSVFSGTISGDGGLTKSGTGSLTLTGVNTYSGPTSIDQGLLVVNGAVLNSPITVQAGGTLGGSGIVNSVTLADNATLAPGNSPGTLTVLNDVAFNAGSNYQVEIESGLNDSVVLQNGSATIANGAVLDLQVSVTGLELGNAYTILQVVDGSSGSIVVPGSGFTVVDNLDKPLLTEVVDYSSTAVTVTFQGLPTPWAAEVTTRNQAATANGVQSLGVGNPIYNAAVFLDEAQLDQSFDLLSGEINASAKGVLINDSEFLRGAVFNRLTSADNPGGTSGIAVAPLGYAAPARTPASTASVAFPVKSPPPVAPAPTSALWAQGFGSWGSTDGNGNAAALDRDTGGFFIGADSLFGDWRVGVLGGYSQTSFDVNARSSSGNSDNIHAGLYAGTSWGAVNFRAGAAYSWNDISTSRFASLPISQTLKADYDAGTAQAFGELGYGIQAGAFDFEPFAGLAYVNLNTDGFTEIGGPAALRSASDTTDVTYTTLGLRASTRFDLGEIEATLKGMLGWRHAFGDVTPLSTYAFEAGSSPFTIAGLPIAEDSLLVDVGLDMALSESISLGVAYSGQFGDGSTDQSVRGTLDWKF